MIATVMSWFRENGIALFVLGEGSLALETERRPGSPALSDQIVNDLSLEAYGRTRPHLPGAGPQESLEELALSQPESGEEPSQTGGQPQRHLDRALATSEWTLRQTGVDPTWHAVTSADVEQLASAGLSTAGLIDGWRRAGLTERQQQVLFATQLDLPDSEIGEALKIAPSTVRNTRARARHKIRDFSESE
ncbi:MAG: hypothetical protein WB565_18070 [Acidimicrobiales bacterium]